MEKLQLIEVDQWTTVCINPWLYVSYGYVKHWGPLENTNTQEIWRCICYKSITLWPQKLLSTNSQRTQRCRSDHWLINELTENRCALWHTGSRKTTSSSTSKRPWGLTLSQSTGHKWRTGQDLQVPQCSYHLGPHIVHSLRGSGEESSPAPLLPQTAGEHPVWYENSSTHNWKICIGSTGGEHPSIKDTYTKHWVRKSIIRDSSHRAMDCSHCYHQSDRIIASDPTPADAFLQTIRLLSSNL